MLNVAKEIISAYIKKITVLTAVFFGLLFGFLVYLNLTQAQGGGSIYSNAGPPFAAGIATNSGGSTNLNGPFQGFNSSLSLSYGLTSGRPGSNYTAQPSYSSGSLSFAQISNPGAQVLTSSAATTVSGGTPSDIFYNTNLTPYITFSGVQTVGSAIPGEGFMAGPNGTVVESVTISCSDGSVMTLDGGLVASGGQTGVILPNSAASCGVTYNLVDADTFFNGNQGTGGGAGSGDIDASLTLAPESKTVQSGNSATYFVTITSQNGGRLYRGRPVADGSGVPTPGCPIPYTQGSTPSSDAGPCGVLEVTTCPNNASCGFQGNFQTAEAYDNGGSLIATWEYINIPAGGQIDLDLVVSAGSPPGGPYSIVASILSNQPGTYLNPITSDAANLVVTAPPPCDQATVAALAINVMKGCVYSWGGASPPSAANGNVFMQAPDGNVVTPPGGGSGVYNATLLDRSWGAAGPAGGANQDRFLIIWQGRFTLASSTYTFTSQANDGAFLLMKPAGAGPEGYGLVLDHYSDHASTDTATATGFVSGGTYDLYYQYYDNTGDARAFLSFSAIYPEPPANAVCPSGIWNEVVNMAGGPILGQPAIYGFPGGAPGEPDPFFVVAVQRSGGNSYVYSRKWNPAAVPPSSGLQSGASGGWVQAQNSSPGQIVIGTPLKIFARASAIPMLAAHGSDGQVKEAWWYNPGGQPNVHGFNWVVTGSPGVSNANFGSAGPTSAVAGGVTARAVGKDGNTRVAIETCNMSPAYTVTPANLDFTVPQNSALSSVTPSQSQDFTITNTGGVVLTIGINENISWADINNTSLSLNPGQSATLTVTVNNTSLAVGNYTGNINFTNSQGAGDVSRPVNYTVTIAPPAAPGSGSSNDPDADNGGGGGAGAPACETLRLTWSDNSNNEDGFYVYRDDDNNLGNGWLQRYSGANLGPNTTSYVLTPPDTNPYYYFVSAHNNSGLNESNRVAADNNPVASIVCGANLTGSDKDITEVRGVAINNNSCNGSFETTPAGFKLFEADVVSFRINICNDNPTSEEDATNVRVTDYLTNLQQPPGGWQVRLCDGGSCNNMTFNPGNNCNFHPQDNFYHYCATNNTLLFTVEDVPQGQSRSITFNAQISAAVSAISRFNNRAEMDYDIDAGGTNGFTRASIPWLPYYSTGDLPSRGEVPPQ